MTGVEGFAALDVLHAVYWFACSWFQAAGIVGGVSGFIMMIGVLKIWP